MLNLKKSNFAENMHHTAYIEYFLFISLHIRVPPIIYKPFKFSKALEIQKHKCTLSVETIPNIKKPKWKIFSCFHLMGFAIIVSYRCVI